MTNERDERRAKMLDKVRKLLAMGRGQANANESETAMRQANKLMAEYGIAEAEADMTAFDNNEMVFGEAQCGPDGRAPEAGKVHRTMPSWAGILAVGIGAFTDSVVIRKQGPNGHMLVFQGEKQDVLLARWLFGVLVRSIQDEQLASGWTQRGESGSFRNAAASTLQTRLKTLARERRAMYEAAKVQSNSRALVVVDRKHMEISTRFGAQRVKRSGGGYSNSGAAHAGSEAGKRINIPAGRPIGGGSQGRLQ